MSEEEIIDVGDPKKVKKEKRKYKLKRERELEEIRQILKTSFGKGFLWRILGKCHMFHTISHHEAFTMAQKSGERDVGLWLIKEIKEADPNVYLDLVLEDRKRDDK